MNPYQETLDSLQNIMERCEPVSWVELRNIEFRTQLAYSMSIPNINGLIASLESIKNIEDVEDNDLFGDEVRNLQKVACDVETDIFATSDVSQTVNIVANAFSRNVFSSIMEYSEEKRSSRDRIVADSIDSLRITRRKLYAIPSFYIENLGYEDQVVYAKDLSDLSLAILGWETNALSVVNDALAQQDLKEKTVKMKNDLEKMNTTIKKIRLVADAMAPINVLLKILKIIT